MPRNVRTIATTIQKGTIALAIGLSVLSIARAQNKKTEFTAEVESVSRAEPVRREAQQVKSDLKSAPRIEPFLSAPDTARKGELPSKDKITRGEADRALLLNQGNDRSQAISREIQSRLGPGIDPERVRFLLQGAPRSPEARELLNRIKSAGKPLLDAERNRLAGAAITAPPKHLAKDLDKGVPRKLTVEPLPSTPPKQVVDCEKTSRIDELRAKVATETEPASRDRLLLVAAANHVGLGDWQSAKTIYDQLAATSSDPAVLEAVRRNLLVVDKQLQVLGETDPGKKEKLELDLAAIHHELGHEQVSKRICRELIKSSRDEAVREGAARLHNTTDIPSQLPALPGAPPPGQGKTGTSGKGGAQ